MTQLPTGGSVSRGNVTLSQTVTAQAASMVVNQTSQRAVVNWDTFNVGQAASVHFVQPNAQAVTLNRINDANPSQIYGRVTATGQVYLTNASGVYFSPTSTVDVGGLVATTHSLSDDDFMAGKTVFERNGATGKVINQGKLTAGLEGYIALLAPEVQNAGVVLAQAGTVVMAAGDSITLNFVGNKSLASITTTASTIATLVDNKLAVLAPDGQIILSSIAANKLQGGVVKNSGNLEANSLVNKGGKIVLEGNEITLNRNSKIEAKGPTGGGTVLVGADWQGSGDLRPATKVTLEAGATIDVSATRNGDGGKVVLWSDTQNSDALTQVHGSITAQGGPLGGAGGQVETSGHQVDIAGAAIDTSAPLGTAGQWLIDPYDYTIGSTEASAIATALGSASVTVSTLNNASNFGSNGSNTSSGDITVNSAITWSANTKLTLNANRHININAAITANGTTSGAGVSLLYNQGNVSGDYNFGLSSSGSGSGLAANFAGSINFGSTNASFTTQNYTAALKTFTLVSALSPTASIYCAVAATCDASNTTNYALANNIDATTFVNGASKYNNLRANGTSTGYNGTLEGLGHTLSKLSLGTSGTTNVALFYATNAAAVVRDLKLSGVTIAGGNYTASLVGNAAAGLTVNNVVLDSVSATSSITSTGSYVGGLLGSVASGTSNLTNAYVLNTNVSGASYVGGVVGQSYMTPTNVHKTGNVTATSNNAGGVFGYNSSVINTVDSVGDVSGSYNVGGLVGDGGSSTFTNVFATGKVTGSSYQVGGLIGSFSGASITNAVAGGGAISGANSVGGLVGWIGSVATNISNASATGNVSGSYSVGGLVGLMEYNQTRTINQNSYATGTVTGSANDVGGLVGRSNGSLNIYSSYFAGASVTSSSNNAGGLVGGNSYTLDIRNAYVNATSVRGVYNVGGVVGNTGNFTLKKDITGGIYGTALEPYANAAVTATGVTTTESNVGGVAGYVGGTANISDTSMTGSSVTGAGNYAGGLVGYASTAVNIANAYAKSTTISGTGYVGGLAGNMGLMGTVNGGSILNSYFEGTISLTGTNKINYGGLVGYMVPGSWLSNSYYNIDTSTIDGNKVVTPGGLFNAQYTTWSAPGVSPASRVALNIANYLTFDNTDNTYVIDTSQRPADLSNMLAFIESGTQTVGTVTSSVVNGYSFKLGANLDMSGASIPYIPYFGATAFKGNTYSVNNFSFNRPTSGIGFLGVVQNSTLTDLKVNSVAYASQTTNTVNARDYVGTAIGSMYGGTLAGATATLSAKVNAQNFTGGLAGYVGQGVMYNASAVLAPTTSASVIGLSRTGGLVGSMDTVAASTLNSNLPVTGTMQVGGLTGYLKSDFTTSNTNVTTNSATGLTASGNVVAAGTSSSATNVGGLIGEVTGTTTAGIYTLANSSATGTVSSSGSYTHFMGGLIGTISGGGAYNNLQSIGAVTQSTNAYGYGYVGGLIGYINASTTLSNSSSSSPVSASGYYAGGLIGYASGATVNNSSASGAVTSTSYHVGGLVGYASGGATYNTVFANGNVSGGYYVGGLIGSAYVNVTNAFASGNVTGTTLSQSYTGGVIGYLNASYTLLDAKYITGSVSGTTAVGGIVGGSASGSFIKGVFTAQSVTGSQDAVGGLVGKLGGTLTNSPNATSLYGTVNPYSTSSVTGRYDVGGLVGRADTAAVISNASFAGSVSADLNYGGILGYLTPGAQVSNTHYNIDAVPITGTTPTSPSTRVAITGLVTLGGLFNDRDHQYTQWFNGGALSGLSTSSTYKADYYFGASTAGVYSLSTVQNLRDYLGFADQTGLSFRLAPSGSAIDMTGAAGLYIPYVSGSFDPNGKSITNVNLSQFTSNLGFIGHLQGSVNTQVVAGLSVTDAAVLGKTNVGIAVGSAYRRGLTTPTTTGNVTGSDITYAVDPGDNSVSGKSNVGGVVGYAIGTNSASAVLTGAALGTTTTSATVNGGSDVGGMIGRLWLGTVINATSTGTVTGTGAGNYVGGLIGFSDVSTVINNVSHTTGLVSGVNYVGGLMGQSAGTIGSGTSGYTTSATSKVEASGNYVGGLIGNTNGGTVTNATASGSVTGLSDGYSGNNVGGLIGQSGSAVSASSYTGLGIKAVSYVGGLIGNSTSTLTTSSVGATTTLVGTGSYIGGLVGMSGGAVSISSSSANVNGGASVGGLVGYNNATITTSTASNAVTGSYVDALGTTYAYGVKGAAQVGGLVGVNNYNSASAITSSTSNTTVLGLGAETGGFVGQLWVGTITTSGSSGTVYGINETGGFAGSLLNNGSVSGSYANANVINSVNTTTTPTPTTNASSSKTGGFVGYFNSYGSITNSRAAGYVKGTYNVGGFVGYLTYSGSISTSYATGMVTGTGDSAGGFAGYAEASYTGTLSNFYAMGAVKGNTRVGGLVGYADRGTFSYGFSTGYVTSSSNATSIGGSFGALNTSVISGSTYYVTRNNLYFDTTTSNRSTDTTGGGGTGAATGLTTTALQGALPHSNFATATWGTGTGLYPYLKVFYPTTTPQAISGFATLTSGAAAARAQVGLYSNGLLLNGGTASAGVNGYYYELVGASALRSDALLTIGSSTKLGATLTLDGQTNVAGMVYSDAQTLTVANNLVLADSTPMVGLKVGLTRERTGAASGTLLNNDLDATFGATNRAVFSTSLPTRSSLELTATAASFDLNTALSYSDSGVSNAGLITVTGAGANTNITLSGGTITSTKAQTYNAPLTLGADETLTGTTITTSASLDGGNKYLSVVGDFFTGGALSNAAQLSVVGNSTFGGNVATRGTQSYSGNVLLKTAATSLSSLTAPATGANITLSGNLGTAQTLHDVSVQTGTGTLTINGSVGTGLGINAFTASGANLALQGVDALQSVTLSPAVAGTVGAISGNGTRLTMAGTGTLTLTTNNLYAGGTTVSSGSLQLGTSGQLGSGTYSADIAVASGAQLQFSSTLNQTLSGTISGNGGLRKDTSTLSTLTLAGNNSYGGTTTIAAGSVLPTHANALGSGSGATVIQSGGVLDVSNLTLGAEPITLNGGTVTATSGNGSVSGAVTLAANSFLNAASNQQLSLTGSVTSGSYGVVLKGAGNFQLNNSANAISLLASDTGIGSLSLRNSTALSVGTVNAGGTNYSGLSASGDLLLQNTAALSLDASTSSSAGEIDLVASRVTNNAGSTALQTSVGKNWRVWSTNATPFNTSAAGGDGVADLPADFVQYNVSYGNALQGTGKGLLYSLNPDPISVSLTGPITKTYDGTNQVSVAASNYLITGLIHGDQLSAVLPSQSVMVDSVSLAASPGVGSGKKVVVTGMSLLGLNAGKTVYGYRMSTANVEGDVGVVVPAPLQLTLEKTYDASTQFVATPGYTLSGMVNHESAPNIVSGSANTASPNAATYTSFANSSFMLDNPNYTMPLNNVSATIQKAKIGIEMTANYSGSTTVTPLTVNVFGLVGNETIAPTSVVLNDKNVSANGSNYVTALLAGTGTALAGNYTFMPAYNPTPNTGTTNTITLNPVGLSITANNVTRTYSGSAFAGGGGVSYSGFLGADTAASMGGALTYAGNSQGASHAGSYTLTPGGLSNSNYNLSYVNGTLTINPATLTPTLSNTNVSKAYDGTTTAPADFNATYTFSGLVAGDTSASLTPTSSTYNDAHVLTANTLTLSGLSIGSISGANGSLPSDYVLSGNTKTVAATITPKAISVLASKTYDGSTSLNGSQVTLSTGVGSEVLSYSNASANDAHVATTNKFIQTITLGDGVASGGATAGLASDYQLPVLNATNAPVTIHPATLSASVIDTGVTKVYDGTRDGPAAFVPSYNVTGFVPGDSAATLSHDNTTFNDANVVAATTLTVNGLRVNTVTGNKNSAATDYVLDASSKDVAARITPKNLRVIANNDAVFFADSDTPGYKGVSYVGLVNGESAASLGFAPTITNSVSLADHSNPGVYVGALTPSGITSTNYTVTPVAGNFTVLGADNLLVKVTNISSVYGSSPTFSIESAAYKYTDPVLGVRTIPLTVSTTGTNSFSATDALGGSATFSLVPDVGGLTSSSGNAKVGVYNLMVQNLVKTNARFQNSVNVSGTDTVLPKALTVSSLGIDKVYDGNTSASAALSSDKFVADDVTPTYTTANFSDKNVGYKTINISGIAIAGNDAVNYSLVNTNIVNNTSANITPKALTLAGITASNKVYDGNATATVSTAGVTPAVLQAGGMVAGDSITVTSTGTFRNAGNTADDKNVGTAKTVALTNTLGGTDLGNYTVTDQLTTNADITPKALSAAVVAANKVYNGNVTASPTLTLTSGLVGSETLGVTGTASFADKNVGTAKTVTVDTVTLSDGTNGGLAANYSLVTGQTTSADITPKALTATVTATNKVYDGNLAAAPTFTISSGLVGSETLGLTGTASFADKNVGTAKPVTVNTVTLADGNNGGLATNYSLVAGQTTSANITPKALTLAGITASNKVYDATATATVSTTGVTAAVLQAGGMVVGDSITVTSTGTFRNAGNTSDDKNVGTAKTVALTNTLGGTDLRNYSITDQTTTTANITPLALSATVDTAQSTYGSALAPGAVRLRNVFAGDVVQASNLATVDTTTLSSSGNPVAGNYTQSVVGGLTGTDAANYTFTGYTTNAPNYTIQRLALLGSLSTGRSVYGSPLQFGSVSFSNVVGADDVSPDDVAINTTGRLSTSGNLQAGTHTQIQSVGTTLSGADANNYSFAGVRSDYVVDQLALTIGGITASNKVYDGNATATVSTAGVTAAVLQAGGMVVGDSITIASTGTFRNAGNTADDKNVGTAKTVALTYTLGGTDLGNYSVTDQLTTTADITPKALSVSVSAANKVYNGNATAAPTLTITSGLVGSETLGVTSTASFADKNVGTAKTVTVDTVTLANGSNGGLATNYSLVAGQTTNADITPKALTASVTAANKVYNGNATAAASLTITAGLVGNETLGVTGTASFADKNVGTAKTVTVDTVTLSDGTTGGLAANYSLVTGETTSANITPKALTATVTATNKVYDGNLAAAPTFTISSGLVGSETLGLTGTASFADKNVGTAKPVTVNTVTLADGNNGGLASNYSLVAGETSTADITPKALTIGGITASNKVYDGNATATVSTAGVTPAVLQAGGMVVGDSITVTSTGTFRNAGNTADDKNVGTAKTVALTNTLGGTDLGNYTVTDQLTTNANITPKTLTATVTAANKVYDGNVAAAPTLSITSGLVGSETLGLTGTASFADKNVGTAKPVTVDTVTLANGNNGGLASNYSLVAGETSTADITPKALTLAGITASNKVYDGNATATVSTAGVTPAVLQAGGMVAGDSITVASTGTFRNAGNTADDKNVGTAKTVALTNTLGGTDLGNYTVTDQLTTNADITPKALTIGGITASNKVYDGNATATVSTAGVTAAVLQAGGMVVGDSITVASTGTFRNAGNTADDKNVGTAKTVALTNTLGGTDLGNYTVTDQLTTNANITRLSSVTWTGGATGNWLDPANWAGGAVPDLSNVARVILPGQVDVTFSTTAVAPAQSGPVHVDGISALGNNTPGSLRMNSGSLVVGDGGLNLAGLNQTGGSLSSAGRLNVTEAFSQTSTGTINVTGDASIANQRGNLTLGNLHVGGNLTLNNSNGNIVQASATALSVQGNSSLTANRNGVTADVLLANNDNTLSGLVSVTGNNVTIQTSSTLNLGTVSTDGDLTLDSRGRLDLGTSSVTGKLVANTHNNNITQTGALEVKGLTQLDAGTGTITLNNANNHMTGTFTTVGIVGEVRGAPMTTAPFVPIIQTTEPARLPVPTTPTGAASGATTTAPITPSGATNPPAAQPDTSAAAVSAAAPTSTTSSTPVTAPVAATSNASTANAVGEASVNTSSTGVVVNTIRAPNQQALGIVAVLLPKGTSSVGLGVVISLPEEAVQTATQTGASVKATLPNGNPLPAWIKYVESEKGLVIGSVPEGGLPFQVLLTVGNQRTVVQISESQFSQ